MTKTRLLPAVAIAALLLGGAACSDSGDDDATTTGDTTETTVAGTEAPPESEPADDAVLEIHDAWAKATEEEMSAAFGVLANPGEEDVTIVSATTEVAGMVELHETIENEAGEMVMQEREGGFVIPAGGELELQPGADHLMLMSLTQPLLAGEEITVTLTTADGETIELTAIVKDYSGANERYEHGEEEG